MTGRQIFHYTLDACAVVGAITIGQAILQLIMWLVRWF
jgi:hypothetical protein